MPQFFDPTPDALAELEQLADKIPEVQQILVENHEKLKRNDRGAHQQQIAGGKVTLTVADQLPPALDGLGLFEPGVTHVGIGRMSTGLGCPHIETDLDFLGTDAVGPSAGGAHRRLLRRPQQLRLRVVHDAADHGLLLRYHT